MKGSEKLIQTIQERDIRQVPKSWFVLRKVLIWSAFSVSVLLGAAAFSVILFCIQQTDFNLIAHLRHSRLELFLGLLPFFWLFTLAAFLVFAMFRLKHTPRGYKFSASRLVTYNASLSVVLGALFFLAGAGRRLEQTFDIRIDLYESMQEKKVRIWSMPEQGFLSGSIISVADSTFLMRDFQGNQWLVNYGKAFIPPVISLETGEQIKLIGKAIDRQKFNAEEIRPWGGPGFRMRHGRD